MTSIGKATSGRRGEKILDKVLVKLTLTVQFLPVFDCFRLFNIYVKKSLKNKWIMKWQILLLTLSYSELYNHKGPMRNLTGSLKDQAIMVIKQHRNFSVDERNVGKNLILDIKWWTLSSPLCSLLFGIMRWYYQWKIVLWNHQLWTG